MNNIRKVGLTLDRLFYSTLITARDKKLIYKDMHMTYYEFYKNVVKLSNGLNERYNKGTRMAVLDWNTLPYLQLLFGIPCSGNVIHPVNIRLPVDQIILTIKDARDNVLFVSKEFLPIAQKIENLGLIKSDDIYLLDESSDYRSYSEILDFADDNPNFNLDENDPAFVLFTSGTTGNPKEVIYTHKQIILAPWSILTLLSAYPGNARLNSKDVMFSLIPNYHIFSWGTPFIATMIGADYVLDGKFDVTSTIEAIRKNRVTWMSMVPTMLYALLSHPSSDVLNGMKILIGGSPIPSGLVKAATAKGIELTSIYGFTDGLIAGIGGILEEDSNLDFEKRNILSTLGMIPAPFSEFKVEKTLEGEIGEIYFRAPWLPGGYENNKEKTLQTFTEDGWFKPGDAGKISNGRVEIMDRTKDLIKSGAEFIPSALIESAISDLPEVESVAVIGVPHEKWVERPIAIVKTKNNLNFDENKAREYLMKLVESGKIQKWWIPDKFIQTDNIPLTGTGKIDKKVLKDMFGRN